MKSRGLQLSNGGLGLKIGPLLSNLHPVILETHGPLTFEKFSKNSCTQIAYVPNSRKFYVAKFSCSTVFQKTHLSIWKISFNFGADLFCIHLHLLLDECCVICIILATDALPFFWVITSTAGEIST